MNRFLRATRGMSAANNRFGRAGQAMAEMAVVLPVLLLLLVGIIEMASAWRTFQVVTNAVREGARVALLPTADLDQVRLRVQRSLEAGGVPYDEENLLAECREDDGTLRAEEVCGPNATGTEAVIRYEAPYTFRLLQPIARLACRGDCNTTFGTITISSTSTMRNE